MSDSKINIFSPSLEHDMLRASVRKFAETKLEPQAQERDREEKFDIKLFRALGDLGLLGITVPEEYGGSGMDAVAAVIAHEELSASDPGFCLAYLAHAILCVNNIAHNASHEQKQLYLPKLCSGEHLGAMAMSEPQAGTDVMALNTTALKSGQNYIINGRKMWITNGAQDDLNTPADILFLYAKISDVNNNKKNINNTTNSKHNMSSFIIERGQTGYHVGQKLKDKLGMRASITAELVFDDCLVKPSQLIGLEGDALLHMMRNLEIERLTLAAMSLGIARRCLAIMNSYAQERLAFGQKIARFGQIQKHIAESYAKYKACRAYVYNTAYNADLTKAHGRVDSDGVKLISSTCAKEIADSAIQVLGGYGYMGDYVVERLWRDAKLLEIGGGTLEAHQKNISADLAKNSRLIFE